MTEARSTKEEGETEIHRLGYQFIVTLHCSETKGAVVGYLA